MWLTNYRAVAIGLALALSPACADPSPSTDLTELRRVAAADPAQDLSDAIRRDDLRFIGVYGFATEVPGVPDYWGRYDSSYGLSVIAGTSDTPAGEEGARLNQQARQYAQEYNLLLLKHLTTRGDLP